MSVRSIKRRSRFLLATAAATAGSAIASQSFGQIAYVTTELSGTTAPVGVFYKDAGVWTYAGPAGTGSLAATYGITRNGSEFLVSESVATTGRIVRMGFDGTVTPLANPITSDMLKLTGAAAPSIQGITVGPDNKMYISTAFGTLTGTGIWRANLDGSGLENIIAPSSIGDTANGQIRDVSIADLDGNASNGFDVFFGTRGGFGGLNRPYYHYNINGATATKVETLTTTAASPSTVFYDPTTNKLYVGHTSAGAYQVGSLDPTGTGQTPTVLYNNADVAFDILRIGGDVVAASASAGGGLQLRYVTGPNPGSTYADFASISAGAIPTARQVSIVDASELTTATFNGAGADNNFTTAGNYAGGAAPNFSIASGFGPRVTFIGSARLAPTNDVVGGKVGSITFDATAGAYNIGGNGFVITVAGGISNLSTNTQTFSLNSPITVSGGAIAATNGSLVFNNDVAVATGGLLTISGDKDITFNGKLTFAGTLDKNNLGALQLNNAGNDYTGRLNINRGKLVINSASSQAALGAASSTLGSGGGTNDGVIELSNNVTVSKNVLLAGRTAQPAPAAANTFLPQIRSTGGTNALDTVSLSGGGTAAVIQSDAGSTLNITNVENRNGTTGASGVLFQGAGNTNLTGTLGGGTSSGAITVLKTGTGTLNFTGTYGSAGGITNAGSFTVLAGTVAVNATPESSISRGGTIQIESGATFDATAAGTFDAKPNQTISGSGTLRAANINLYDDGIVNVGNNFDTSRVGTLTLAGNTSIANNAFTTTPKGLYYDIAGTPTSASDKIQVNGDLTLSSAGGPIPINVFSLEGTYATGSYRLIDVTGGVNNPSSAFSVNLTGGAANYRQTFTVDANTAHQVNLVVGGAAKSLTWHGDGAATGDKFAVKGETNFLDGATPDQFYLGDTVNFVDDATADATAILQSPIIGRVNVNAARDYTIKNIADYDTATAGNQPSGFTEGTVLTKSGSGTLTLDSTAGLFPNWAGSVVINGGVLVASGNGGGLASLPFGLGPNGHAATTIDGGTLRFVSTAAGASGRTFTLGSNGGTVDVQTVGGLTMGSGGQVVQFVGDGNRTLTFTGTTNLAFGGVINNPAVGVVNLVKSGSNTVTLSQPQGYAGTLTVNSGRVTLGDINGLGSAAGATTVNDTGGVTLAPAAGTYTSAESFTISGTGAKFGGAQETTGALRISNAAAITTSGSLTVAANANIGVDDAAGIFTVTGAVSGPGGLTKVGAGKLAIGNGTAGSLNLGGALAINVGSAVLNTPGTAAGKTAGLTLAAGTSLDLAKSKLVVDYTDTSPLAALTASYITGSNSGAQNGAGIRSSFVLANTPYTIGIVEAADALHGGSAYFGQTGIDTTAVIVATVLKGDTDVSGTVNFTDLLSLAQNYGGTGKTFSQGDSNYDSNVNFADLLSLAQNYGQSGLTDMSQLTSVAGASFASDWALAQSLVPEPTTGLMAGLLGLGLSRRRRAK